MPEISVTQRVQVVVANPGEERQLNKIGRVVMVVDGVRFLVQFADGSSGVFEQKQLKKVAS